MKFNEALQRAMAAVKIYIDKVTPTKLSDLEIDMELGAVKTVNNVKPDEQGNVDLDFMVTITKYDDGTFSADKSFDEIVEAHESHNTVKAIYIVDGENYQYNLVMRDKHLLTFTNITNVYDSSISAASLTIDSNNKIGLNGYEVNLSNDLQTKEFSLNTIDKTIVGAINEVNEKSDDHINDSEVHVTEEEKNSWDNKSNFSGKYEDLIGKPTIPTTPSEVGAEPKGTAQTKVSEHNMSEESHNDIRLLIQGLTTRLNTLANSDDTTLDQMEEVVAYIKNNKSLIDGITTSKINVSDIIDNLTTSVTNKPLSAKQGVILKDLIDAIVVPTLLSQLSGDENHRLVTDAHISAWNAKSNFSGSYNDLRDKPVIPEGADLTGYATETYVKEYAQPKGNYLTEHQDITGKADKSDIPTKISQLNNDAGYLSSIPSEYVTESELNNKGYLTEHQDLSNYAKKDNIPTKVSQLSNDSNYITSIPSEYVTESELDNKGFLTEHQDLSSYALKANIPTKVSQLTNDNNYLSSIPGEYITETELNNKGYLTEHQDLSNYALKSNIPTSLSQLNNDGGFITSTVDNLVNYYKTSDLYTKDEVNTLITTIPKFKIEVVSSLPTTNISETTVYLVKSGNDTDNLYTEYIYIKSLGIWEMLGKQNVDLTGYALSKDIPTKLSQLENDKGYITSIPSEYVTDSELNAKGYLTEHQDLSSYAKTSQIPTKTSQLTNDSKFLTSIPSEYITDTELNAKGYLTQHQDISGKADKATTLSGYGITDGVNNTTFNNHKGDSTHITSDERTAWNNKSNFSGSYNDLTNKPTIPTKTSQLTNDSKFLTSIPSEYVTESDLAKFGGTVEVTSGSPTKENTVLTINPNTDEISVYSVEEVDAKIIEVQETIDDYPSHKSNESIHVTSAEKKVWNNKVDASQLPTIVQEAGESESLVMSQKGVTALVHEALGQAAAIEYETVDSVDEMINTTKQYVLSTTGTIWTYGSVTVEKEAENRFVPSTATLNQRHGTSALSSAPGYFVTDYIEVQKFGEVSPYIMRPFMSEGVGFTNRLNENNRIHYFDENKTIIGNKYLYETGAATAHTKSYKDENGNLYWHIDECMKTNGDYDNVVKISTFDLSKVKYVRCTFAVTSDGESITIDDIKDVIIKFDVDAGTTTENRWYDTKLTPSASGGNGGGNYVDLLVKVNQNKSDIEEVSNRVTSLETGSETLTIPSFWQSAVDECVAKIKALQIGRNCITFPFFSDNHQRIGYSGMLIAYIMKECNIPYAFFGGDSIDSGYIASEAVMIEQDRKFDAAMSYIPNGRFCRAVGNHDGYWAVDANNKNYYTDAQNYELFLREESIAQNKHFGGDGTYYYVDDVASKVRFVVLDTNDGTVETEQINWLQNTALSFNESGWGVVFISHQPISNHYHAGISNAKAVASAIVSTANTKNIPIMGWYSGHIHRDIISTKVHTGGNGSNVGTENGDLGFTQVIITSDHTGIAYDDATKHTVANDDKSHAIDFVTINKATRTVNITRLGIGNDRSYTY